MPVDQLQFHISNHASENQPISSSYQGHYPQTPSWKSAKSWTFYFVPFLFLKACVRSGIGFVQRYCILRAQLFLDYQGNSQLFFILNVDIFFPHFQSHYRYSKPYINHIHLSYSSSSLIGPPGTIFFSLIHSLNFKQFTLLGQFYLDTKTRQTRHKKIKWHTSIPYDIEVEILNKDNSTLNPTTYKKDYTPWPSGIYPMERGTGLAYENQPR